MLYLAELETSHYTFRAAGLTPDHARAAVAAAVAQHAQAHALDPTWPEYVAPDVNVYPLAVGAGYRDGDQLAAVHDYTEA